MRQFLIISFGAVFVATVGPAIGDIANASAQELGASQGTTSGTPPSNALPQTGVKPESPGHSLSSTDAAMVGPSADGPMVRFRFRHQPWSEVIEWFAEQADLSLIMDTPPPGTFNYTDSRPYNPADAIDLLNSVLQIKGFTLIRHERMLVLVNLEDEIPADLIPRVSMDQLSKRGDYELVSVLFRPKGLTAEEASGEIGGLIGPQGSIVVLNHTGQLLVTETAGKLRVIHKLLLEADDLSNGAKQVRRFEIPAGKMQETVALAQQLLALLPTTNATEDGTLRIALHGNGRELWASGDADKIARLAEVIQSQTGNKFGVLASPQLEVYDCGSADPPTVLAVLQTLLDDGSDVHLSIDEKSRNLIALARPEQQATVKATIKNLQRDGRLLEVIPLRSVEPQLAVLSISKLLNITGEEADPNAPLVDADPLARQLLVRGTQSQIDEIRQFVGKMESSQEPSGFSSQTGNVRLVPLSGKAAEAALQQAQRLWPSIGGNPIRVITPSVSPSGIELRAPESDRREQSPAPRNSPKRGFSSNPQARLDEPGRVLGADGLIEGEKLLQGNKAISSGKSTVRLAQLRYDHPNGPAQGVNKVPNVDMADMKAKKVEKSEATTRDDQKANSGAPIVVAPGQGGLVITSDDPAALSRFEELLTTLAGSSNFSGPQFTVFYLKYAEAEKVATSARQILQNASLSTPSTSGEGLANLTAETLQSLGGGLAGSALGLSGEPGSIGSVVITPDARLNALIVEASPSGIETLEQLLKVLDQPESPEEVMVWSRPKMIPIYHADATAVADIVRQVYQERMVDAKQNSGGGGNSPAEFFRRLREGRGGNGGGGRGGNNRQGGNVQDAPKISIGVDERTNSLIVSAPDNLFSEVKELVAQLDEAPLNMERSVRVVTLKRSNAAAVQQAISAIAGDSVQTNTLTQSNSSNGRSRQQNSSSQQDEANRRRAEFFNRIRQGFGGGQGSAGRGGGPRGGSRGGRPGGNTSGGRGGQRGR